MSEGLISRNQPIARLARAFGSTRISTATCIATIVACAPRPKYRGGAWPRVRAADRQRSSRTRRQRNLRDRRRQNFRLANQ
jgi:predicted transcriptional regulator of viral defense system